MGNTSAELRNEAGDILDKLRDDSEIDEPVFKDLWEIFELPENGGHTARDSFEHTTVERVGVHADVPAGGQYRLVRGLLLRADCPRAEKKLELALLSLRTSYSWPNIRAGVNNEFRYSHDDGATLTIALSERAYEIEGISAAIQSAMRVNGDWEEINSQYYVTLAPNLATLKVIVTIAHSDYQVDIANSSLMTVLGWPAGSPILTEGTSITRNIVQISDVNEVLIQCDAVAGSYTSSCTIQLLPL